MNEQISRSDPRWDGRIESIARKGWALDDLRLRARLSPWDRRRMEQVITDYRERLEAGEDVGPKRARPEPIATPEETAATYEKYQSQRKAAEALGISRTQLRRLLGLD